MGLLWFILLAGITGMAVDATNGFRNRTMLQATADAAVLAAAIDLPNEAAAVASAVSYSVGNMPDIDSQLVLPSGTIGDNPGLAEALREQSLVPRMVNHVDEIMLDMLAMRDSVLPSYINMALAVVEAPLYWVGSKGNGIRTYDFANLEAGRVYHLKCPEGEKNAPKTGIPDDTVMSQGVIISDCPIHFGSNISLRCGRGHARCGQRRRRQRQQWRRWPRRRECEHQLRGGTFTMTSNNASGICSGGAPGLFAVDYYRLVL